MTVRMVAPLHPVRFVGVTPVPVMLGAQIVIPASEIDEALIDFPLVITERDLPEAIFASGGISTIQAYDGSGNALTTEAAWINAANETARIHVKVPFVSAAVDTVVNVYWDETPSDTGAVFTMYDIVIPLKVTAEEDVANYGSESISLVFDAGTSGGIDYTADGVLFTGNNETIKADMAAKNDYYASVHGRQGDSAQKTMLSCHVNSSNRANITIDNGNEAARWDSTNGWLDTSPIQDPGVGNYFTMAMMVDDGTEHNIWFNGGFKGTDASVSATTDRTAFRIGLTANSVESWVGEIQEARISGTIATFTDAWVKYEHTNLENTSDYTVTGLETDSSNTPEYLTNVSFLQYTEGESPGSQNITDGSNNGYTVTVTGDTNIQADGSVYFDGNGDYYSIPHASDISVANTNDMLIEVEFNWDGDGDSTQSLLNKRDGTSAEEFRMTINGGNIEFITFISGSADINLVGPAVSGSTWYNFKAERVNGTWTIYLDDNPEGSQTEAGTPSSNSADLNVGHSAFNSSRQFKGYLRKVKITQTP